MGRIRNWVRRTPVVCALWIAVCFSLTSAVWISWEYHLLTLVSPAASDLFTMVLGYLLQAAGAVLTACWLYFRPDQPARGVLAGSVCAFFLLALPSLLGTSLWSVLIGGLGMNLLCGVIAGFYLYAASRAEEGRRGSLFGCGYALSTLFVFLLSLPGRQSFLRNPWVLVVDLALAAAAIGMAKAALGENAPSPEPEKLRLVSVPGQEVPKKTVWLALGTILLMSLVKNMGFSFGSADLADGVSLELSRIFYALGLIAAGLITDRNRQHGALCTACALVIPFITLSLRGEMISSTIFWGLDYVFFGFFSVFRVVLTMDLAARSGKKHLAPLGLAAGRIGDAAGTALCIGLGSRILLLVLLTLGLFVLSVLLFFRLYHRVYTPETVQARSEREIFEEFSIQHDLSAREKDVLRLLIAGEGNAQIADALFVSESTIKYHVHNLLQKTGCKSRQELLKKYNLALFPSIAEKRA